mmetsp:Transcript_38082/g.79177  ORF Transcript_38082/g.79177 Transcript_38082/m.79177 type:complete len:263 (-) Transcript_38082:137-925(-)
MAGCHGGWRHRAGGGFITAHKWLVLRRRVTRVRRSDNHRRHGVKVRFLVRTAGSLKLGSLDLGADHALAEEGLSTEEQFMVVTTGVSSAGETAESIEIQLALEGSKLGLAKVFGHHIVYEFFGLVNDKATSMGLPGDDMCKSILFDLVEDSMKLQRKRHGNSSLAASMFIIVVFFAAASHHIFGIVGMIVVIVHDKVTVVHLGSLSWLLGLATTLGAGFVAGLGGKNGSGGGGHVGKSALGFGRNRQLKGSHQTLSQSRGTS